MYGLNLDGTDQFTLLCKNVLKNPVFFFLRVEEPGPLELAKLESRDLLRNALITRVSVSQARTRYVRVSRIDVKPALKINVVNKQTEIICNYSLPSGRRLKIESRALNVFMLLF